MNGGGHHTSSTAAATAAHGDDHHYHPHNQRQFRDKATGAPMNPLRTTAAGGFLADGKNSSSSGGGGGTAALRPAAHAASVLPSGWVFVVEMHRLSPEDAGALEVPAGYITSVTALN